MAIKYLDSKRIRGLGKEIVGLKAYFTLNESTGDFINTASAIGSTGAISNFDLTASSSWAARGQVGGLIDQCPAFGSTSKATADDSNLTDTNFISQTGAEWTICLWLKQNTVAGDGGLFSTTNHETGEAGVYVRTSTGGGGTGSIQLLCGSEGSPNDRINVISTAVIPNTQWNFLMVQYSDTTGIAKIQINTTLQAFPSLNLTNTKTPSDKFQLGNNQPMDNFFNGDMDEVSVWNRILTTAQITDIYNAGLTGTSSAGESLTTISSLKETADRETLVTAAVAANANWTFGNSGEGNGMSISGSEFKVNTSTNQFAYYTIPTSIDNNGTFYCEATVRRNSGDAASSPMIHIGSTAQAHGDPAAGHKDATLLYFTDGDETAGNLGYQPSGGGGHKETNSYALGDVQSTGDIRYYSFIMEADGSSAKLTCKRYTQSDRSDTPTENSTSTFGGGGTRAGWEATADLTYVIMERRSSTANYDVLDFKFWNNQEDDTGDPDINLTFSDIPAASNLEENTIFDETDTRSQYWLQTLDSQKDWFPTWYDTFATNKGWTAGASSTTNIDTTNRLLNVIHKDAFYIEIPELDTKWLCDLDVYWDDIGSNQEYIVFTSYAPFNYPSGTGSPQFISIRMEEGNGTLRETIRCTQFVGSETNTNDGSKISGTVSDTWYYYRLVRDGDGVTLTRYSSDANRQSNTSGASCAYPDFVGDIGWVESTKIKYINTTGHSTNCNFDVKNIRIYNGVTSI